MKMSTLTESTAKIVVGQKWAVPANAFGNYFVECPRKVLAQTNPVNDCRLPSLAADLAVNNQYPMQGIKCTTASDASKMVCDTLRLIVLVH